MPHPQEQPNPRATTAAGAEKILSQLEHSQQEPAPVADVRAGPTWTVLVAAFPTPPDNPTEGLSDCDRDCLALLAQVSYPVPGERLRDELEKRKIGVWSVATVKRSLARLKAMGLVCNSRKKKRGYFLPERLPLVWGAAGQQACTRS